MNWPTNSFIATLKAFAASGITVKAAGQPPAPLSAHTRRDIGVRRWALAFS